MTVKHVLLLIGAWVIRPVVRWIVYNETLIVGDERRVSISKLASVGNALVNANSGSVTIGDYTFAGHDVKIITGTHLCAVTGNNRIENLPRSGRDITIGRGVWLCSNSVVLGPCVIEDDAVIAAGAVVLAGTHVGRGEIWGGVPARLVSSIKEVP